MTLISQQLSFPQDSLPSKVRELVEKGLYGLKPGQGFYRWQAERPEKQDATDTLSKETIDRMI